ncbi:hypothetical protein BJ322DRAFT_1008077, partial [Thelephora terrestris]
SFKFIPGRLKDAEANADSKTLGPMRLPIKNIVVQQAPVWRRRTYRTHGPISPSQGHPCRG